jgi:hypothetical protein
MLPHNCASELLGVAEDVSPAIHARNQRMRGVGGVIVTRRGCGARDCPPVQATAPAPCSWLYVPRSRRLV